MQYRSVIAFLLFLAEYAVAFPAATAPQNTSTLDLNLLSNLTSIAKPPGAPACSSTLGTIIDSDECEEAINRFPHDPIGRPVTRNFYTDPDDFMNGMPNVQVPFESTYRKSTSNHHAKPTGAQAPLMPLPGRCTVQVLLATNFIDVPTDQTSWINLIGPARVLWRKCAGAEKIGGVLVRNGNRGNLELTIYNPDSVYGRISIIRHSSDEVAKAIAQQELIELLHLAPNVYDGTVPLLLNGTGSAAISSA